MNPWHVPLPGLGFFLVTTFAAAQPATLELKNSVERSLAPKDSPHEYVVNTPGNQAFTLTVQQQGIDVVVSVVGPDGKQLVQVDGASDEQGTGGSEVAHVTALKPGAYRVRIAPFDRPDAKSAKYTVALSEMRDLSAEERANAESEAEIVALEERWEAAIDKLDVGTLRQIIRTDGFALGPVATAARTREQLVSGWEDELKQQSKNGTSRQHTISEHSIRAAGNTAVSTGRFLITFATKDQGKSRFMGQFVHVWSKNADGWRLVSDYTFPFGRIPRPQSPSVSPTPTALSAYAGAYRDQDGWTTLNVTVDKGTLNIQWATPLDKGNSAPLNPITETTFLWGNDELTFVASPGGKVNELIVVSDGPAGRFTKVGSVTSADSK